MLGLLLRGFQLGHHALCLCRHSGHFLVGLAPNLDSKRLLTVSGCLQLRALLCLAPRVLFGSPPHCLRICLLLLLRHACLHRTHLRQCLLLR
jgi:hypothetical protein